MFQTALNLTKNQPTAQTVAMAIRIVTGANYAWQKMHIQMNGDAKVCCFWTQGPSGNVVKEDPWEVWNSPTNQEIRKQLMGGELRPIAELATWLALIVRPRPFNVVKSR